MCEPRDRHGCGCCASAAAFQPIREGHVLARIKDEDFGFGLTGGQVLAFFKFNRRKQGRSIVMAKRRKSFGSKTPVALLLTSLAGVTLSAATAQAEDCLAAPNSPAREGTRWHYRLDQATQHKCWYMRALDQSTQQAATPVKTTPAAPAFAIPIPRPRPSTADSALSLNSAHTDPSPSHAEEIDARPSAAPPVSGSTGERKSPIPKESISQQASATLPNAVPQTGTTTDEIDSAISEMNQAAPSLEANATATAAAPNAETLAGATIEETNSSTSEISVPQLVTTSSAPKAQMATSGSNAAPVDDPASSTPNDSATKLSAPADFRSSNAEPAPDVSGAQPNAPLSVTTLNARPIPSHLVSDNRERTAVRDESPDNAGTQIRPFYPTLAFVVALVGILYYLVFRYLPGGGARISIDDTEIDWVSDDQYGNPEFYRKLREGPALDKP
jgi:hypothetical protein